MPTQVPPVTSGTAALAAPPEPKIYAPDPTPVVEIEDDAWLHWTPDAAQAVDRSHREKPAADDQAEAPADAKHPFRAR